MVPPVMTAPTWQGSNDPAPFDGGSEALARASYLAIRQPGVVRFLEERLTTPDGDALATGLELASQLLEQIELADGVPPPRLDHRALAGGLAAVEAGACDAGLTSWVTRQLDELSVLLTASEERRVAIAIASVVWAAANARAGGASDDVIA